MNLARVTSACSPTVTWVPISEILATMLAVSAGYMAGRKLFAASRAERHGQGTRAAAAARLWGAAAAAGSGCGSGRRRIVRADCRRSIGSAACSADRQIGARGLPSRGCARPHLVNRGLTHSQLAPGRLSSTMRSGRCPMAAGTDPAAAARPSGSARSWPLCEAWGT